MRSALQRGNSPEQPEGSGLMASEVFEAAFDSDMNLTTDLEEPAAQFEKGASVGATVSSITSRATRNQETNPIGSLTHGKREKTRKLQENAGRAREAKKKRLIEEEDEVMGDA